MLAIAIIFAMIFGYAFIGGVFARNSWPLQKSIDRRAKAKNPKVEASSWQEHLCFCFFLWPAAIIAYLFYTMGFILTTLFSIGIVVKGVLYVTFFCLR